MTDVVAHIEIAADKVVIVTDDHGGYTGGKCIACGASGWLVGKRYGLPHGSPDKANAMRHEKQCPMNAVLTPSGGIA